MPYFVTVRYHLSQNNFQDLLQSHHNLRPHAVNQYLLLLGNWSQISFGLECRAPKRREIGQIFGQWPLLGRTWKGDLFFSSPRSLREVPQCRKQSWIWSPIDDRLFFKKTCFFDKRCLNLRILGHLPTAAKVMSWFLDSSSFQVWPFWLQTSSLQAGSRFRTLKKSVLVTGRLTYAKSFRYPKWRYFTL